MSSRKHFVSVISCNENRKFPNYIKKAVECIGCNIKSNMQDEINSQNNSEKDTDESSQNYRM